MGDDYLSSYFCGKPAEKVLPEVKKIWDESVSIQVILSTGNVYSRRGTTDPDEQMTAEEMEPLYNYDFYINTSRLLNAESKYEEAKRIFNMIQYIQTTQYYPREILIWYQTGETENGEIVEGKIWFGDGTDPYHIGRFENWFKITSIEEIVIAMDEQWFDK